MSDLISRERAISELVNMVTDHYKDEPFHGLMLPWAGIKAMLEALPSAELERKKGQWVNDGKGLYKCTSCGELWLHWWAVVVPPDKMYENLRYCPRCGAEMRGEEK